jgi:S-methylmethionine-dependent homocysteine/selenocysteine methylase
MLNRLQDGVKILIDGATGSEIEKRGVPMIKNAWNGGGAMTHPDIVRQVHLDYILSGAEVVISNTFSTSRHVLADAGLEENFEFLNRRSVELALESRAASKTDSVLIAGGITHWSFTKQVPPLPILETNTEEQALIMAKAGADLIILEMMSDVDRTLGMLAAARKSGLPVWVGFSCNLDEHGIPHLLDGPSLTAGVQAVLDEGVAVVFIMHTDVQYIDSCVKAVKDIWQGPLGVYAHSGIFVEPNWVFDDVISPEDYASAAKSWLDQGVQIIGGCCGIGNEHIQYMKKAFPGT